MIEQLSGQVVHRDNKFVVLRVGGVGYRVHCAPDDLKLLGEQATLWTYLAVRETALELYGFRERTALEFFQLLLEVPGIGPKSALAILTLAPPETLRRAIAGGDSAYLTRVSGIGKKNAAKIVLTLKDKLAELGPDQPGLAAEADAIEALQSLGYNLRQAREALARVPAEVADTAARVRQALKILGKNG